MATFGKLALTLSAVLLLEVASVSSAKELGRPALVVRGSAGAGAKQRQMRVGKSFKKHPLAPHDVAEGSGKESTKVRLEKAAHVTSGQVANIALTADVTKTSPLAHYWKECVGSGHALLGTRKDWSDHLEGVVRDIGFKRVRLHGVFDDDMSVVLPNFTGPGNAYEFYNVDQLYDNMLEHGVKPIVELSFMPGLIANCSPWVTDAPACKTVMHYQGVVQPPAVWSDWENLLMAFGSHLIARYGINEVQSWHFEVWNELWGMPYPDPYLQLYNAAYDVLHGKLGLQVGGPATMQVQYVADFVKDQAGKFDFVSTHLYPTDPNCVGSQDLDCFADVIKAARAHVPPTTPFLLTEYNAGLSDTWLLYSSYAAAFVLRNIPLLNGVTDMFSYWTFTDIFEENGMHSAPFEGYNYGIQTVQGILKPVYHAFAALRDVSDRLFAIQPASGQLPFQNQTVNAFFTAPNSPNRDDARLFLSNTAPYGLPIANSTNVKVSLMLPTSSNETDKCPVRAGHVWDNSTVQLVGWQLDSSIGSAHDTWVAVGSPAYPTPDQWKRINEAGKPMRTRIEFDPVTCSFEISMNSYSTMVVEVPLKRFF